MPIFDLHWHLEGRATIEADDGAEARDLLKEGLDNLDSSMFESVDVDDVTVDSVKEQP